MTARKPPKDAIAVDFDGVVHDHKNPIPGMRLGLPIPGAREALNRMCSKFRVIIFTVRPDSNVVKDWMKFH